MEDQLVFVELNFCETMAIFPAPMMPPFKMYDAQWGSGSLNSGFLRLGNMVHKDDMTFEGRLASPSLEEMPSSLSVGQGHQGEHSAHVS